MSLRDHLPGAGKRKDEPPAQFYRASHCELRGCVCQGSGKADIAIQDANKNPIGYVCQRGYVNHITSRGMDQMSRCQPDGVKRKTEVEQSTLAQQATYHHVTDILQQMDDLDRYADNFDHRGEDDGTL